MILDYFKLNGYCSIITGGAQGLGKYMANALAEAGSNIVIADIDFEKAKITAQEIKKKGVETMAIHTDVTKEDDVINMVSKTLKKFSKIDVLLNNAGICYQVKTEEMEYSKWLRTIDVNLNGIFLVTKYVGQNMIKNNNGSIINISSMSGLIANHPQNETAYCSSKSGVIMFTKSLAGEWAKFNIRINTIAPGYMNIGLTEEFFKSNHEWVKTWLPLIPMGRPGEPDELGGVAVFLASKASSYITGSAIVVDGGFTVW